MSRDRRGITWNMVSKSGTKQRAGVPSSSAKTVERALDILLAFLREGQELGITDLSRALRLPKGTVHRLVSTLAAKGFLAKNEATGRYRLGLSVFRLGSTFLNQMEVREAALPVLHELARVTGETVNLNIARDRRRVCIEKVESSHDIRHFVELGRPLPLYCGASGKVLLAFLPEEEIEAVIAEGLRPLTSRTVTDPDRLRRELAEIRRRGYAVSRDERVEGASAVSAPIYDSAGRVVAGLTISGPTYRFTAERVAQFVKLVKQGAARISASLGYSAATGEEDTRKRKGG